jgi:hypothetical protein
MLVLVWTLPLLSWGPEGHALVARLAEPYLTAAARARVAEILGPGVTLASIASWPDQIRRAQPATASWHYTDIPIDRPHLDMERDCPGRNCAIAKIEDFEKVLGDPAVQAVQRREALMYLVHFVADMHQPLHSSDHKDRGGNNVRADFFGKPMNLHSVWDSGLLARMGNEDELFAAFSRGLTPKRQKRWARGTVEQWAEEAHKASQKIVYGKLPKVEDGAPEPIGEAYERAADPLIRQQIEKAGARLAEVLNATLR